MTTFHLKLLPQRRDDRLHLEKQRDALLLNGEVVDPSKYDEAGPASQWIVGRPEAIEDGWCISIILPHGSSAPRATRFPIPIVVSSDGLEAVKELLARLACPWDQQEAVHLVLMNILPRYDGRKSYALQ